MKKLQVFELAEEDHLIQPEEFSDIRGSSPALAIVTDFRNHKPPMVNAHSSATEALEVMRAEDLSIKLVIDRARECIGVIAIEDLNEHALLLKQQGLGINRDELTVYDMMHHRHHLRAMSFAELELASVSDIVAALENYHQYFLLVVDTQAHQIRGLVSSRDISRRMHVPVSIEKERTFADIFSAVRVQ